MQALAWGSRGSCLLPQIPSLPHLMHLLWTHRDGEVLLSLKGESCWAQNWEIPRGEWTVLEPSSQNHNCGKVLQGCSHLWSRNRPKLFWDNSSPQAVGHEFSGSSLGAWFARHPWEEEMQVTHPQHPLLRIQVVQVGRSSIHSNCHLPV